ncbi:unnamed protein product [Cyclocybe aegerita]|uniref:Uncharacterized protein n=1 Tax=Cyclocybe aegerita TaxID=1973307 RepID=A0A8S0X5L5_CYCAE|nr:unnamed protein product [Cyclocybe aegerita]
MKLLEAWSSSRVDVKLEGARAEALTGYDPPDDVEQQAALVHLAAHQFYPKVILPHPNVLPPHSCGKLEYFHGSLAVIEVVLAGRRILTLVWEPLVGDPNRVAQHVAEELSFVTAFSHCSMDDCAPPFVDLRNFFSRLQFLELIDGDSAADVDAVDNLPHLIGLIFRLSILYRAVLCRLGAADVRDAFLRCHSLKFVDIEKEDILYRK